MIVAGTGHRFLKFPDGQVRRFGANQETKILGELVADELAKLGATAFIGGGALGFDMIATRAARDLGVPYTLALPFKGHDSRWPDSERRALHELILDASRLVYVSKPPYAHHKMIRRNHWMVDNADCVIAFWDGRKSGTGECVLYAWSRRTPVHNIWREFQKRTDEISL